MSSTYLSLYYHLVFSTKNREPLMKDEWRPKLFSYLAGTIEGLGGCCEIIGGMEDHVHVLVRLRATHTLADFMREMKKSSSAWVHRDIGQRTFAWQDGYAAFTVSAPAADKVWRYIENQAAHHRQQNFLEELKELLVLSGVEFDEKYLG